MTDVRRQEAEDFEFGRWKDWNVEVGKHRQMLGERFHVPGFKCQDSTPGVSRPDTLYKASFI